MDKLYHSLLKNKFLILILLLGFSSFLILFLAETYLSLVPRVSEILRSIAAALLTSGIVGFVFDYQTRKEFAALVSATVQTELLNFERRFLRKSEDKKSLHAFWQSFMKEGLSIIIPEDESGVEPMTRVADISAAIVLNSVLIQEFTLVEGGSKVNIDFIIKGKTYKDINSFSRNLVVIGAPGANPLSTTVMNRLYGLPFDVESILNGYVFAVDISHPQKYLENPYIIPRGDNEAAILKIKDGKVVKRFERDESKHKDGITQDACLLVHGIVPKNDGQTLQVLVIAGHSRFSVMDGINFVLNNENWAEVLAKFKGSATATVLEISDSVPHGRKINVAEPPHLIHIK